MEMTNINITNDSHIFDSNDQNELHHNNSMALPDKKEFNRVAIVNIPHEFRPTKVKSKHQRMKTIQNDNNLSVHYLNRRMLALDRDK